MAISICAIEVEPDDRAMDIAGASADALEETGEAAVANPAKKQRVGSPGSQAPLTPAADLAEETHLLWQLRRCTATLSDRSAAAISGYPMQKPRLADMIAFSLTDDIVSHRLAPGAALDEATLARRFGASRTLVREALRELAASGLVELRPHRVPIVAKMDGDRLAELFEVMADLEALCATRAATAMSAEQRARLEAQHREMGEAVRQGDVASYRAGNVVFHTLISDGACNTYLSEITQATRVRLGPYRGAQLEAPQRLTQSYAEHDAILSALLRGESQKAADLMRRHLALTRETLRQLRPAD